MFTAFITIPDFFKYTFFDHSLISWILAVLLIVLAFSIKNSLAKFFVYILKKTLFKHIGLKTEDKFKKTLSWIFPLLAIRLVSLLWFKTDVAFYQIINPILLSLTIIWLLIFSEIIIHEFIHYLSQRKSEYINETIYSALMQIIRGCLIMLGIIMVLNSFNINVAALITGLGIGGLAVSMAAKDIIANLIGGFTIMTEQIFEIGDYIANPEIEGTVEDIKFRQSKIRAGNESLIIVPNSKLTENYVINYSRMGKRRVDLYVYLPLSIKNEKIEQLSEYIKDYLKQAENILPESQYLSIESIEKDCIKYYVRYYISNTTYSFFMEERDRIYKLIRQFLMNHHLEQPYAKIEFIPEKFPIKKE